MTAQTETTTPAGPLEPAPWTRPDAPTPILVDVFPAQVQLPSTISNPPPPQAISQTRVTITANPDTDAPDTLYVFVDSSYGPALLFSSPAVTPTPDATTASARSGSNRDGSIQTEAGTISWTKEGSCGCGSALKSFSAFTHPYSVA